MTDAPIPLVDLAWQHEVIGDDVRAGFEAVMQQAAFVDGPRVAEFEHAFARFCGRRACIGVANGTDAIEMALRALDVGPGDEVVLPANSFVATAEAVVRAGATPVLVDCDPHFLLVDEDAAVAAVGPRTRAVVPVHLYGQIAPTERLAATLGDRTVIVEDAAQAQGATRHGHGIGAAGAAAATSFYPGKNLGAYGDAGAVLTDDDEIAARLRGLRNHGRGDGPLHEIVGFNSRLDTLQAVVLAAKLEHLAAWNELRRAAAHRYEELLADVPGVRLPQVAPGNEAVWHLYVVRVPRRDAVLEALHAAGIGAGIHYRQPIHLQPAFAGLEHGPGDFPVAEAAAAEILSLPLWPGIEIDQQARVAATLRRALQ